jgi:hypothetical protein
MRKLFRTIAITSVITAGLAPIGVVSASAAPAGAAAAAPRAVAPFSESFEHGSTGTAPTSANTAYDEAIGDRGDGDGTIRSVFDASGIRGKAARFYNSGIASGAFGFLGERVGTQKVAYFRRYYKLTALPSYRMSVLLYKYGGRDNGQLGGTHNGSFAFGGAAQGHKFVLVNKDTNTTQSTATVPVNSWFRVESKVDFSSGSGVQTVRLFLGSNVNGTTPTQTLTAKLAGTSTDYVEDGIMTNPNVATSVKIDEAVNGNGWVGPMS